MSEIEKVVTKAPLGARKNDFAYWQTRPYAERLAALEEIRREYHRWKALGYKTVIVAADSKSAAQQGENRLETDCSFHLR